MYSLQIESYLGSTFSRIYLYMDIKIDIIMNFKSSIWQLWMHLQTATHVTDGLTWCLPDVSSRTVRYCQNTHIASVHPHCTCQSVTQSLKTLRSWSFPVGSQSHSCESLVAFVKAASCWHLANNLHTLICSLWLYCTPPAREDLWLNYTSRHRSLSSIFVKPC